MKPRRPRQRKPAGTVSVDRGNAFGSRVRILAYPLGDRQIWEAVAGKVYTQAAGAMGAPSVWGNSYRGNISNGAIRTEACPTDLQSTKNQTIISVLHGRAASWVAQRAGRLFDTSSGSGWGLKAEYQSSSNILITTASFASVGTGKSFVCDPLAPMVIGTSITSGTAGGTATARMFCNGMFVASDSLTIDAVQAGTDTRVEVFGDTGSSVDYGLTVWFTGALTDNEMAALTQSVTAPWQLLEPRNMFVTPAAVGSSFQSAWARGANTVISTGARA
jgi:hypothetical protein